MYFLGWFLSSGEIAKYFETSDTAGKSRCRLCHSLVSRIKWHLVLTHLDKDFDFACPGCSTVVNQRRKLALHMKQYHQTTMSFGSMENLKVKKNHVRPLVMSAATVQAIALPIQPIPPSELAMPPWNAKSEQFTLMAAVDSNPQNILP